MVSKKQNNVSGRVMAVDVLRGLTVCLMILVDDNVGVEFEFLKHPVWTGISLADFVFPSFITLMGVSMYFSLSKYDFKFSGKAIFRIVRRFVLLFICGVLIARTCVGVDAAFEGGSFFGAFGDFGSWRLMGILQRIALCYLFAGLIVLCVHNRKVLIGVIVGLLVGYSVVLGIGSGYELSDSNVLIAVDKALLSPGHMYQKMTTYDGSRILYDPEGLLSTVPCIAQTLIGFLVGGLIKDKSKSGTTKVLYMFIAGFSMLVAGYLVGLFVPAFKKAWTAPFALIMVGVDVCLLALFTWIIDVKKKNKWCTFFRVYGTNAVLTFAIMYIVWAVLDGAGLTLATYEFLLPICLGVEGLASILTTTIFILILYVLLYFLDKKKIYLRL